LGRNGSFDFAEELGLCVGAKANVPFVGCDYRILKFLCGGRKK